jgi:hypothetical protein
MASLRARAHCHGFFRWYNTEHHHAGLGLLTPADVHHGRAEQRVAARAVVLATAHAAHLERFSAGFPIHLNVPWRCGSIRQHSGALADITSGSASPLARAATFA